MQPSAPLAVTVGDPAGIGPDILLSAWRRRDELALPDMVVYADPETLADRARRLGIEATIAPLAPDEPAQPGRLNVRAVPLARRATAGTPDAANGPAVIAAIETATAAVVTGAAAALVTGPIAKNVLYAAGFAYQGHTDFLAALAERHGHRAARSVMMLAGAGLRVVPVTVHIPLAAVPGALTEALIVDTIRITAAALMRDFGIAAPRIAVAGLNPHAGENGTIGEEEVKVILPAIRKLRAEGLHISGPFAADSMFHAEARRSYDAAIAMYHDQALIPLKTLAFDTGVNVTLGLPFIRTSPDHGTAFDIAGSGKARADSFLAALMLAGDLARRRAASP
jgi:4-hydroxythreonine-4-phosphate dehydrogenase